MVVVLSLTVESSTFAFCSCGESVLFHQMQDPYFAVEIVAPCLESTIGVADGKVSSCASSLEPMLQIHVP